jgi:PIN domain nuclease of toxin-antitoxin system
VDGFHWKQCSAWKPESQMLFSGFMIQPVNEEVAEAVHRVSWSIVPDMPDRIIAATALHLELPLITRDLRIQSSGIKTTW